MTSEAKQLPSLADADWLNSSALRRVFSLLGGCEEVRVVGGAVRDAILGEAVSDIDLACIHSADEIMARALEAGIKAVATGGGHGTVSLIFIQAHETIKFEVTPLRIDVETDGRHAKVAPTQNWALDAQRRDFYLNALYCDEAGRVYDFVGAYEDVLACRVRFIGSPRQRIKEDALRILRFFRFSASYGKGVLDNEGLAACIAGKERLSQLSAERIKQEMFKLIVAPFAAEIIVQMVENRIMDAILPTAVDLKCFTNLVDIERELALPVEPLPRLAALARGKAELLELWGKVLKLSNKEKAFLTGLGRNVGDFSSGLTKAAQQALLYRLGSTTFKYCAVVAWSAEGENADRAYWKNLIDLPQRWQAPVFSLAGADVLALGLAAGPRVGEVLSQLEQEWIDTGFAWDASELEARLKRIIEREV